MVGFNPERDCSFSIGQCDEIATGVATNGASGDENPL